MSTKKTTTATKKPAPATAIVITEQVLKSSIRYTLPDGRLICISFPNKKSCNTYFHKDFNAIFSKIEGAHLKPDLAKHPDDYEYQLRVTGPSDKTPSDTLQSLLAEVVKNNPDTFAAKSAKFELFVPAPKTSAKTESDPNELPIKDVETT